MKLFFYHKTSIVRFPIKIGHSSNQKVQTPTLRGMTVGLFRGILFMSRFFMTVMWERISFIRTYKTEISLAS